MNTLQNENQPETSLPPYVTPSFSENQTHLIAWYAVQIKQDENLLTIANHIAEEATIGVWNNFWEKNRQMGLTVRPKVFDIDRSAQTFKLAIPLELIEPGNIAQILSMIAGNIHGMKILDSLKLLDLSLPYDLIQSFKGPKFGLTGLRSLSEIFNRPLCGVTLKPKLGLDEESYTRIAVEIWEGGADAVFESETMASLRQNNFYERIRRIITEKKRIEREYHEFKFYFPNITAGTIEETIDRLKMVSEMGGDSVQLSPLLLGLPGLNSVLSEANHSGIIVHSTRAGYKLLTNDNGITFLTQLKLLRLLGCDSINTGNPFIHPDHLPLQLDFCRKTEVEENKESKVFKQHWSKTKPILPVVSGGIHPGHIEPIHQKTGNEVMIISSEGVFYHPDGIREGSKALREACNAVGNGIHVEDHAKKTPSLAKALEKWRSDDQTL